MAPYLTCSFSRVLPTLSPFPSFGALFFFLTFILSEMRVYAACLHCGGNAPGCGGTDTCPLVVDPIENAKALVATAVGVITVVKLLPAKVLRCLPKATLETVKAIATYRTAPTVYDFSTKKAKDLGQVMQDTLDGRVTVNETLTWSTKLMFELKTDGSPALEDAVVMRIKAMQETIRHVSSTKGIITDKNSMLDGVHLYIWALTDKCSQVSETVVLHALENDDKDAKGTGGQAKVVRPSSHTEFSRRLNLWILLLHATGVASVLITTPFLEDVVYSTLAQGVEWTVVHELFVVYLQYVANNTAVTLQTVFATGGQDVKFREAEANARLFFRTGGEKPQKIKESGDKAKAWNCECTGSKNKKCISFNLKQNHPAGSLDGSGKCTFIHACDRFLVGEDGKPTNNQCGGNHPRPDCTNAKRVGA